MRVSAMVSSSIGVVHRGRDGARKGDSGPCLRARSKAYRRPMTATVEGVREQLRRQEVSAPGPGQTLSIAETAERTGVSAHTLRYYERIGLLSVGRDTAGQRRYTDADFARVVFLTDCG